MGQYHRKPLNTASGIRQMAYFFRPPRMNHLLGSSGWLGTTYIPQKDCSNYYTKWWLAKQQWLKDGRYLQRQGVRTIIPRKTNDRRNGASDR
jgi:hypothetical protein